MVQTERLQFDPEESKEILIKDYPMAFDKRGTLKSFSCNLPEAVESGSAVFGDVGVSSLAILRDDERLRHGQFTPIHLR